MIVLFIFHLLIITLLDYAKIKINKLVCLAEKLQQEYIQVYTGINHVNPENCKTIMRLK